MKNRKIWSRRKVSSFSYIKTFPCLSSDIISSSLLYILLVTYMRIIFVFFKINFKYLWDASRLDEKNNRNYLILSKREVPPRCSTNTHGPFLKPHAESMQTITKAINKYEMERLLIISHYRFPNIIVNKSIWCSY